MMMKNRNAQAWSIDMIIAVIIFVLMISVIYSVLNRESETDIVQLQAEANNAVSKFDNPLSEECNFLDGQTINIDKLNICFNQDPDTVRKLLGIEHHFCLFIEDKEGRVIYISDKPGIGDEELVIGPTPCGNTIT